MTKTATEAIKSAFTRKQFLWKNDEADWHEKRGDQMRKLYGDKIKKLEGNQPITLLYFIVHAALHWSSAVAIARYFGSNYWPVVLLGWWLGGFFAVAAGLGMHEAAHQLVLKGRWPSMIAGLFGQLPLFLPAYKTFQFYHLPHHSYCTINADEQNRNEVRNDPQMRPVFDCDLPTDFEAWLFSSNPFGRLGFLFCQVLLYAIRPMVLSPKPFFIEDLIGAITQSMYVGSAFYYGGSGAVLYMFCAVFLGSGLHVSAIHFVAEHYLLTSELSVTNEV